MGFFDSVLEEVPKTNIISSSVTKKDEQDGSFLIIDDSITINNLPDTAVELFDTTPAMGATSASSEISFFSEPASVEISEIVGETAESTSEISFFDEPDLAVLETNIVEDEVISIEKSIELSKESAILSVIDETMQDVGEEKVHFFDAPEGVSPAVVAVPEKDDIYAPLRKAIAEYDTILASHIQIAEAKDVEITEYNARAAEAKASAKKALEERKALETEMDRVKQIKELFTAQLK